MAPNVGAIGSGGNEDLYLKKLNGVQGGGNAQQTGKTSKTEHNNVFDQANADKVGQKHGTATFGQNGQIESFKADENTTAKNGQDNPMKKKQQQDNPLVASTASGGFSAMS